MTAGSSIQAIALAAPPQTLQLFALTGFGRHTGVQGDNFTALLGTYRNAVSNDWYSSLA